MLRFINIWLHLVYEIYQIVSYLLIFFDNSAQKMFLHASGSSNCLICACAQLVLIPSTALSYLQHTSLLSQAQLFLPEAQLLQILCTGYERPVLGFLKQEIKVHEDHYRPKSCLWWIMP